MQCYVHCTMYIALHLSIQLSFIQPIEWYFFQNVSVHCKDTFWKKYHSIGGKNASYVFNDKNIEVLQKVESALVLSSQTCLTLILKLPNFNNIAQDIVSELCLYIEKTIFPFPFTVNGIWSWWQFSNQMEIHIGSKTVTAIIFHSLWEEMEI